MHENLSCVLNEDEVVQVKSFGLTRDVTVLVAVHPHRLKLGAA